MTGLVAREQDRHFRREMKIGTVGGAVKHQADRLVGGERLAAPHRR